MTQYVLKRLGLALLTLVLLSLIIFFAGSVLPGNPGRAILGPFASEHAVEALNQSPRRRPPADRPVLELGHGHPPRRPGHLVASSTRRSARSCSRRLGRSLKLAAVAFVIVVPLSIFAGVVAALYRGRADRPEHQRDGPVLHVRPGVRLRGRAHRDLRDRAEMVPRHREPSPGTSPLGQLHYLILPSDPAGVRRSSATSPRMARAGTIEALDSRLRPDGHPQGAAALGGDPAARPAQLTAPDHHRHRHPDRLPDRGPGGRRDAVQLPRPRLY